MAITETSTIKEQTKMKAANNTQHIAWACNERA